VGGPGREHDSTALRAHTEVLPLLAVWTGSNHAAPGSERERGTLTTPTKVLVSAGDYRETTAPGQTSVQGCHIAPDLHLRGSNVPDFTAQGATSTSLLKLWIATAPINSSFSRRFLLK